MSNILLSNTDSSPRQNILHICIYAKRRIIFQTILSARYNEFAHFIYRNNTISYSQIIPAETKKKDKKRKRKGKRKKREIKTKEERIMRICVRHYYYLPEAARIAKFP